MENTAARKRKQVPEGYLIIGIDPHKKRHAAVAITQDFTTRDKFKFDNTREGLETMLRRARMEMVKSDCRGVMFAIEAGGHYWRNIAYFLDEQGFLTFIDEVLDVLELPEAPECSPNCQWCGYFSRLSDTIDK